VRFFVGREPPTLTELSAYAAQSRLLRALALDHGLDPDRTLPEDLLLLERVQDRAGDSRLAVQDEEKLYRLRLERERKLATGGQ
jgi:hypothetical protein